MAYFVKLMLVSELRFKELIVDRETEELARNFLRVAYERWEIIELKDLSNRTNDLVTKDT